MLRMIVKNNNGTFDYSQYVDWTTLKIQSQLSVPTQMTVTFNQYDQIMIPPFERCYIQLISEKTGKTLFTGFVAATPDTQYVAYNHQQQYFQYAVTCTSDEYLLNFKSPPYIPAFINQTQGQILAQLANILVPGFYDTSLVQSGFLVPYYTWDPTQTWSQVAKTFADSARYYYFCKDRKIIYAPYGSGQLGISYDEINKRPSRWNASKLQTTVLQVPTVNDVLVVGDVEAGNSHTDYFIGDGFTGEFPLTYATYQSRSALLLEDDFTQTTMNTQNWTLNDPQNNFDFSAGALNLVSPLSGPTSTGQLIANNGMELAGGMEFQHGEIQFNDHSTGEVGGLYFDSSVAQQFCAFNISTPGSVTLTASGAGGIAMQPSISGTLLGPQIISRPNHHYVLNTKISCPSETRFQQVFATKDGTYFAGQSQAMFGNVTFSIEDVDIGATFNQSLTGIYNDPVSTTTLFTASGVLLPAYAAYALVKNGELNFTLNYCLLSKTPAGSLSIAGSTSGAFLPTGAILPFTGPESEYFGPVSPILSGQIVLSSGITGALAPPTPLLAPNQHTLGFGLDEQDASVIQGANNNNVDTLGFYLTTTPAAGSRVVFTSNESQRAVSRVINLPDVEFESGLVGDDGHRSAVVSNMSPLPRTSEDCDAAAQAYLYDREQIFYNGTYTAESDLFEQNNYDFPYYPFAGRNINVNCPARNVIATDFLVTQVVTTVLEIGQELLSFVFTFGADTRTEKLLSVFTPSQPTNILTTIGGGSTSQQAGDTANIPIPQVLAAVVTGSFLPDLIDVSAQAIVDANVYITVNSPLLTNVTPISTSPGQSPGGGLSYVPPIIVKTVNILSAARSQPGEIVGWSPGVSGAGFSGSVSATGTAQGGPVQIIGPHVALPPTPSQTIAPGQTYVEVRLSDLNWGQNSANLVARYTVNSFTLVKNNYDQTWYMRLVQFDANDAPSMFSRRSKIIRVRYPFRPASPTIVFATTADIQLDFAGDQRNIYGIELRTSNDETVLFQQSANDTTDMYFNLQQVFPQLQQIAALDGPPALTGNFLRGYNARFFNHQWLYSNPTAISIPAPPAPQLSVGVRFAQMLQINSDIITSRDDIAQQILQLSFDNFASIWQTIQSTGQPGSWSISVPSTGNVWARSCRFDLISSGAMSSTLMVPQGDLIASDYLATQGSVPPVVTNNVSSMFSYVATSGSLTIVSIPFGLTFPNAATVQIPSVTGVFTSAMSVTGSGPLKPSTVYSYFPLIDNPLDPNATLDIAGLYSSVPINFINSLVNDGIVALSNGALTATTAASGTSGGSSGGGSIGGGGGGNCTEESEPILLSDGSLRPGRDLIAGHFLKGPKDTTGKIKTIRQVPNTQLFRITTESGRTVRCSEAHAIKINKRWASVGEMIERLAEGEILIAGTVDGDECVLTIELAGIGTVTALTLTTGQHVYYAAGFESHNGIYKPGSPVNEDQAPS